MFCLCCGKGIAAGSLNTECNAPVYPEPITRCEYRAPRAIASMRNAFNGMTAELKKSIFSLGCLSYMIANHDNPAQPAKLLSKRSHPIQTAWLQVLFLLETYRLLSDA
jgi:hypothetical protein